jgi:hypothetical protein
LCNITPVATTAATTIKIFSVISKRYWYNTTSPLIANLRAA